MFDKLTIVIPVYNEGEVIIKTLDEIRTKIHTPTQVLVVYDFDEDTTLSALAQYPFLENVKTIKNNYGRGALNAIKTGFENAPSDAPVLVAMADLSDDLGVVDEMFEMINKGYDVVCGSRYMKGGVQIGGPVLKKFLSRMAGISLHYLTGVPTHDITNSFKLYGKKMLKGINIESTGGFELGMEIVCKAYINGYKIGEVPSTWRDRSQGVSKFKMWQWIPHYLHWYWFLIKNKYFKKNNK